MKKRTRLAKILAVFLIIIFSATTTIHILCTIKSITNYDHNVKAWKDYDHVGIINDQADFKNLKYGFGDIAANGCGAVSIYNILTLEGQQPFFPDIIQKFDINGENFFGIGGSKPSKVIKVLKDFGFEVTYTIDKYKFEEIAQNSKYAIYVYFGIENFVPFGHYQLLYNFDGSRFSTINLTGKYTFDQITNIDNLFLEIMIGVN